MLVLVFCHSSFLYVWNLFVSFPGLSKLDELARTCVNQRCPFFFSSFVALLVRLQFRNFVVTFVLCVEAGCVLQYGWQCHLLCFFFCCWKTFLVVSAVFVCDLLI